MTHIDGNRRAAAAALSVLLVTGGTAMAGSLGGPLELQDEGSFFVNGQTTVSSHPVIPAPPMRPRRTGARAGPPISRARASRST